MYEIYFRDKLQKLSELTDEWVPCGKAISKIALKNTNTILSTLPENEEFKQLDIAPFVNGSVFINYRNNGKHMCVNVAETDVSGLFYTKVNGVTQTVKSDRFTLNEIDKIVDFVKNIL